MSKQHPLAGLGNFDVDARQAQDERIYEEEVVKALLTAYRQDSSVKHEILQWVRENTTLQHLTLVGWHRVTGIQDDVFIQSAVVRDILKSCTLDKMLRKFETRNIAKKYLQRRDDRPDDYSGCIYALVVKCPWVRVGVVVHDGGSSVFRGARFTIPTKKDGTITVETFDQFIRNTLHVR